MDLILFNGSNQELSRHKEAKVRSYCQNNGYETSVSPICYEDNLAHGTV